MIDTIDTSIQKLSNIINNAADSSNIPKYKNLKYKIGKVTVKENKK